MPRVEDLDKDLKNRMLLPPEYYSQLEQKVDALTNALEKVADEFRSTIGVIGVSAGDMASMDKTLERITKERTLEKAPEHKEKSLALRDINVKNTGKIKGDAAVAKAFSALGIGGVKQIPLPHSGFAITIGIAPIADRIALTSAIMDNRMELGFQTISNAFTSETVSFASLLVDFAIDHMHSTTLDLKAGDDIRKYISYHDLPALIVGLISSMHPAGVKTGFVCSNVVDVNEEGDDILCDHIETDTFNLKNMYYIEMDKLTEVQRDILARTAKGSVSMEDYNTYRAEFDQEEDVFTGGKSFEMSLGDESITIHIDYEVPSILDYLNIGDMWVEDIKEMVVSALNIEDERQRELRKEAIIEETYINTYAHYVKRIIINGDSIIESHRDIMEILKGMAVSDGSLFKDVLESINDFIYERTFSVIGTPKYRCPACQREVSEAIKSEIIPLNVFNLFLSTRVS